MVNFATFILTLIGGIPLFLALKALEYQILKPKKSSFIDLSLEFITIIAIMNLIIFVLRN